LAIPKCLPQNSLIPQQKKERFQPDQMIKDHKEVRQILSTIGPF
jgi:hypothetical protein